MSNDWIRIPMPLTLIKTEWACCDHKISALTSSNSVTITLRTSVPWIFLIFKIKARFYAISFWGMFLARSSLVRCIKSEPTETSGVKMLAHKSSKEVTVSRALNIWVDTFWSFGSLELSQYCGKGKIHWLTS